MSDPERQTESTPLKHFRRTGALFAAGIALTTLGMNEHVHLTEKHDIIGRLQTPDGDVALAYEDKLDTDENIRNGLFAGGGSLLIAAVVSTRRRPQDPPSE